MASKLAIGSVLIVIAALAVSLGSGAQTARSADQSAALAGPRWAPQIVLRRPCKSLRQAQIEVGVQLRRIREPCGFTRVNTASPRLARCARSWVCVWQEGSGPLKVLLGAGQRSTVFNGTWRYAPGYPLNDAVRDICRFLRHVRRVTSRNARYEREPGQPHCR